MSERIASGRVAIGLSLASASHSAAVGWVETADWVVVGSAVDSAAAERAAAALEMGVAVWEEADWAAAETVTAAVDWVAAVTEMD